jgi:serine O-acetyltransferase
MRHGVTTSAGEGPVCPIIFPPPSGDPIWEGIWNEADGKTVTEPDMSAYLNHTILRHNTLDAAIADLLSAKLTSLHLDIEVLRDVVKTALYMSAKIRLSVRRDLEAVVDRDPAARGQVFH